MPLSSEEPSPLHFVGGMMAGDPHSVSEILDRLRDMGEDAHRDPVELGEAVEMFGKRSVGPFLLVPALIEVSPIGGIPAVPTLLAMIIALSAAQILFGRDHIWLPSILERRHVKGIKVVKAADKLAGIGRWMDRWFHGRMKWLTGPPFDRIAAGMCILLCATVPPLELIPFASTAPMAAIAAFGLALLVRDGALMAVAMIASVAALGFAGVALLGQ